MSRIQDEIKQKKPFRSPAHEASLALMRTADMVRRAVAEVVDPYGLTLQQYNVLRILRGAGEQGLPTLDIAERMIEEAPGITRLIDRLETKKLVERERCKHDRRKVWCRITKDGLDLLEKLDAPISDADKWARVFSQEELAQLVSLLDKSRSSLMNHTRRIG